MGILQVVFQHHFEQMCGGNYEKRYIKKIFQNLFLKILLRLSGYSLMVILMKYSVNPSEIYSILFPFKCVENQGLWFRIYQCHHSNVRFLIWKENLRILASKNRLKSTFPKFFFRNVAWTLCVVRTHREYLGLL